MLRIKLWHRVFAVIALATLLAVATMLVVQQQTFRRGLLDYINQIDRERALRLIPTLVGEYREAAGWDRLRANPMRFRWLLDKAIGDGRGIDRPPPEGRPGPDRRPFPGGGPHAGPPPRPPGMLPPGERDGDGPRRRYALYDAAGLPVIGPPRPWPDAVSLPIDADGRNVGNLVFQPLPRLESSWDLAFARSQLTHGIATGLMVLALAIVASMVFARRLVAPLRWITDRAKRIAGGDYAARVASQRSDEIGELGREFDSMAAALERNCDARQRWTAEISHELRTPIAVIRAELDALEDGVRKFDVGAVRSLSAEAERLSRLVEDLYQLSLADAGALAYRFDDLDLSLLLGETLDAHGAAFASAGLQVEADLPSGALVRADGGRVRQLFANLCANSCRYTDAGGKLRVTLKDLGARWAIAWDDSAPGVPDAALPRLFDPLFRVDASRSRAAGGAGLGLAIARRIVEAHGATIAAEASPLGGLRIQMEWPKA
jgi:two-component system sensor histidine kinase BaeS